MSKRSRVTTEVELEDSTTGDVEVSRQRRAAKGPRRTSWAFWLGSRLLVVAVLLFALLAFAPWIISATGLWKPIFAWSSPELAAKVEIGSLSLGWMSGIDARGVVVRDSAGQTIAEIARVSSRKTLLQLAQNQNDLGTFDVTEPRALIVLRADGSNIEDFLASLPKPTEPSAGRPTSFALTLTGGAVALDDQIAGRQWQLGNVNFDLAWPALATEAKTGKFSAAVRAAATAAPGTSPAGSLPGENAPGELAAEFVWQAGTTEGAMGTGQAQLKLGNLPTELSEGALRRFVTDIRPQGALTIDATYQWADDGKAQHIVLRQLSAPQLAITSADLLDEDRLALAIASGTADVELSAGKLAVRDLKLDSNLVQIAARGEAAAESLSPAALIASLGATGASDLELSGDLDVAALAAQLRHTLRLREGIEVTSGTLYVTLSSKPDQGQRRLEGSLRADALRAVANGREYSMDQPISLAANIRQTPQGFVIDELTGEANFLTLRGNGTLAAGSVTAHADLDKLAGGLSQFVDLGNSRLAGILSANLKWSQAGGEAWTASADARVQQFELAAANLAPWRESDLQITAEATGKLAAAGLKQLDAATLTIASGADRLEAELTEPVEEISAKTAWPAKFTMHGDLATWTPRLQAFVPLGGWRLAGAIDATGSGRFAAQSTEFLPTTVKVDHLSIDGPGLAIREPIVKIDTAGAWDQPQLTLTLGSTTVASSSLAFRADGVRVKASSEDPSVVGVIDFRGDLARLSSWIGSSEMPRTWQATGAATGRVEIGYRGQALEANWTADVENLAWLTPPPARTGSFPIGTAAATSSGWETQWTEPRVSLSGQGSYDPVGGKLQLARASLASSVVSIAAAGTVSELSGPCLIDLTGEISYDLEPISERLRTILDPVGASMPTLSAGDAGQRPAIQTLSLVGKEQRPFVLNGPLFATALTPAGSPATADPALAAAAHRPLLSEALQGEASLGWQKAEYVGLIAGAADVRAKLDRGIVQIGPLDIPLSDGRLTTAPRVLLNDRVPALIVDRGPFINNVQITPEMCHLWLKYVAPLLADATRAEGKLSLGLEGAAVPLFEPKNANVAGTLAIHTAQIGPGPLAQHYLTLARQVRSLVDPKVGAETTVDPSRGWLILPEQQVPFEVAQGYVVHHGLTMTVKDVIITTEGRVGIDDQSIDLVASIPIRAEWFKSGDQDKLKTLLAGQVLKIPIGGTLAAPKVDSKILANFSKQVASSAVKGVLDQQLQKGQGLLQQELGKGLDKLFGPLRTQPPSAPVVPMVPVP